MKLDYQNLTIQVLPNTPRASSRFVPRSTFPKNTSLTELPKVKTPIKCAILSKINTKLTSSELNQQIFKSVKDLKLTINKCSMLENQLKKLQENIKYQLKDLLYLRKLYK